MYNLDEFFFSVHFADISKTIAMPKGATKKIDAIKSKDFLTNRNCKNIYILGGGYDSCLYL